MENDISAKHINLIVTESLTKSLDGKMDKLWITQEVEDSYANQMKMIDTTIKLDCKLNLKDEIIKYRKEINNKQKDAVSNSVNYNDETPF